MKDEGSESEVTRITVDDQTDIWPIRHNVARNPIGMVPNALIASAPGKENPPPNI